MLLTANGVDIARIALWLGHESITTTQIYRHADPALKQAEAAIARTVPLGPNPPHRPADHLLAFLEELRLCGALVLETLPCRQVRVHIGMTSRSA